MMGRGGGLQGILFTSLVLCLSLATIIVGTHGQTQCNAVPPSGLGVTVDDSTCNDVAVGSSATYTIWYERQNSTNGTTLSVVLSVPVTSGDPRWYAMGFNSAQNNMVGTSAIIFWLNSTSQAPLVNTYYITAHSASAVTQDSTRLKYTVMPQIKSTSTALFLTFEVNGADADTYNFQNFVIGAKGNVPTGALIDSTVQEHADDQSIKINFATNQIAATTSNVDERTRTHGILNIIGWGVLLPHGAIIARYFRSFDPHWFYAHAAIQIIGFAFVLAGLITGLDLENDAPGTNLDTHKALAIFVFALACIQISAILIRPKKEAKLRRYWNWGHWWVGRVALVVAAINIFVGIHIADASKKWKLGYGFALAGEIVLVIGLETWLWISFAKSRREPRLPQTAMQNRGSPRAATPASPPPYETTNWDDKQ